jgi:hypothetical protein
MRRKTDPQGSPRGLMRPRRVAMYFETSASHVRRLPTSSSVLTC